MSYPEFLQSAKIRDFLFKFPRLIVEIVMIAKCFFRFDNNFNNQTIITRYFDGKIIDFYGYENSG